jgi:hypothetical protein
MKFLYTFAALTLTTEADLFLGCNDIKYNNININSIFLCKSDVAVEEKEYYSRRKMLRIYIKITETF